VYNEAMKTRLEKAAYPVVEKWLRKHFLCFQTAVNKGLKHGRADVIGIRDVGGDLTGDIETIVIEVKRGLDPFATASGQTLGYNVVANRVYLADVRPNEFTPDELQIASHLGIGLIQIRNRKCTEILSSPFYSPIRRFNFELLGKLGLGKCQMCGSFFRTGTIEKTFANLARENLRKAIRERKGVVFWNEEVAERKDKLGIRSSSQDVIWDRRYICPDCIDRFISQISVKP
jgi:hypothetical protein